jgi:hypothetical protein
VSLPIFVGSGRQFDFCLIEIFRELGRRERERERVLGPVGSHGFRSACREPVRVEAPVAILVVILGSITVSDVQVYFSQVVEKEE